MQQRHNHKTSPMREGHALFCNVWHLIPPDGWETQNILRKSDLNGYWKKSDLSEKTLCTTYIPSAHLMCLITQTSSLIKKMLFPVEIFIVHLSVCNWVYCALTSSPSGIGSSKFCIFKELDPTPEAPSVAAADALKEVCSDSLRIIWAKGQSGFLTSLFIFWSCFHREMLKCDPDNQTALHPLEDELNCAHYTQ